MKKIHVLTAVAAAAFLAGCGGSDPGNQTPTVQYTRMINFGDSLSDVGTYRTALVAANGEGLYSINGDLSHAGLPYTNWTQYLAAALQLAQPCAAETGLDSPSAAQGGGLWFMAEAAVFHDNATEKCYSYAQGGARVTIPYGPANRFFWDNPAIHSSSGWLGQLTVPLVQQVTNFTTDVGAFTSGDLVTVLAGGNDLFVDRGLMVDATVGAVAAGGGLGTPAGTAQITGAEDAAVAAMAQAGTELATLVLDRIVGGGATHVVVVNLPDVNGTPDAHVWVTTGAGAVANPIYQSYKGTDLTLAMVKAFNGALATGLGVDPATGVSSHAEVLYVDAFTASDAQIATPATFGLTNVTTWACDPAKTGLLLPDGTPVLIPGSATAEPTSLFCTKDTLITDSANVTPTDPSGVLHYQFADAVHPTPYGYRLLSELVIADLAGKGWL